MGEVETCFFMTRSPGEKPERPSFNCTDCSTRCTQKQVLMRHYREKHQPGYECVERDCDYKWTQSRKSEYRKHLREQHGLEDDNVDKILGPPRRRGRNSAIESDPLQHFSPPSIERGRRSLAKPQQRPLMPPVLAVGEGVHHTSPPLASNVLEHLAATHAPSRLLPEDFALLVRHYKIHGGFRFVHALLYTTYMIDSTPRFPSTHPGGSTTADPITSFGQQ